MVKVLHVVSSVGTTGGVQGMLWSYYKHMDENDIRFDFTSFDKTLMGFEKNFTQKGSKVFLIAPKREGVIRHIRDINKVMKSEKYDIVHVHQDFLGYIPLIIAWLNGIKVRIIHTHKANLRENFKQRIRHKVSAFITTMFATHIWACGIDALKWSFGSKYCGKDNAAVINNAIETQNYKYDESVRNHIRKELKIDDSCKLIGNVARFTNQKNHKFLIDIFEQLHKSDSSYKLMLIGEGELFEDTMNKVKAKGLSDSVIALGSRNDVNELMQAMDIFLLPSVWEGLGIVLVEAQCSGLLCFASDAVPQEVNITGGVIYIELKRSAKEWAEEIMNSQTLVRQDTTSVVAKKGYDIKEEAKRLQGLYHSLLKG